MPLYKAYGELTSHGATRTPFLLDLSGTTPVALVDTATAPDLNIKIEIQALTEPGGAVPPGSGLGVRAYIQPVAGRILTDLQLRLVIWPSADADAVTEGTNPHPGNIDFVALEYRTTGTDPLPLVVLEVGQLAKVHTTLGATAPADIRIDDEYKVEACTPDGMQTLHLVGGLVTGPLEIFPGRRINPTGAYGEHNTSIRGIDLARVLPAPPPTAASPVSATWFDVTAAAPSTPPPPGTYTHLKVTARQPHAAPAPTTAPAATPGGAGLLLAGSYTYAVAFAHANGNETPLGPSSPPVVVPANGSVQVNNIPTGPAAPAANPEYAVVARHLYRTGPDGGDPLLVGVLAGPSTPTTFLDHNDPIPVGGAVTIAAGAFRPASRLSVRYAADSALRARRRGGAGLHGPRVEPGRPLPRDGVRRAHLGARREGRPDGPAGHAPAGNPRPQPAPLVGAHPHPPDHRVGPGHQHAVRHRRRRPGRRRARCSGSTGGPSATCSPPSTSAPPTTSRRSPTWCLRSQRERPASSVERPCGSVRTACRHVARGRGHRRRRGARRRPGQRLRCHRGAGPALGRAPARHRDLPTRPGAPQVHGHLLLGDDPSRPPGHDRGLRVLRERRSSAGASDSLRWSGRAGVLPDLLAVHYTPFDTTPAADVIHTEKVVLEGVVERAVINLRDGTGLLMPDDPTGLHMWGSLVTTVVKTPTASPRC